MPDSSASRPEEPTGDWLVGRAVVTLRGNQPWLLADREHCWAIVGGAVDVFAVHVGADGETGARRHVAVAGPGQLLCGGAFAARDTESGVSLLAVPSHTTDVVVLTRDEVAAMLTDPAEQLLMRLAISDWAETLSVTLAQTRRPSAGIAAAPGAPQSLSPGQSLTARGGAACVRLTSGAALLVSDPSMPLNPASGWIPLTSDTWLETQDDTVVETLYLAEALAEEPGLSPIDTLYGVLLKGLLARFATQDANELRRLRRRSELLREAFSRTLVRQASVLAAAAPAVAQEGDELLAACRILGGHLGVRFVAPPRAARNGVDDQVAAIARASHVRYRRVTLSGQWWRRDHGPLLATTRADAAPVPLVPASAKHYRAWLPGAAQPRLVDAALAAEIAPVATMFYRPLPEGPVRGRDLLAYVLRGNRRDLAAVLLLALLAALVGLALPLFTELVFTVIVPAGDYSALATIAVLLFVLAVTVAMFAYTRGVMTVRIQTRADNQLQAALWDRLLALPPVFFRQFSAGDLATRVISINQISALFFSSVFAALLAAVFSLVNLVVILTLSPALALLALALVALAATVLIILAIVQVRRRRLVAEQQGKLSGVVLQFVSAVAKLRDAGAEERAFMRWSDGFVEMTRSTVEATRLTIAGNVFNAAFPLICTAGAFAVFFLYLPGSLQTGPFMAYTSAFMQLLVGLAALSMALTALAAAAPLYERTRPILEATPEVDESKADPGALRGRIEVDHITFAYDHAGEPVIRDLSLEIRPGEFVAIVGPSGSGKSTLLRLLLGFETPDAGEIHYDGQNLRTLDLGALRRQISTVLQSGRVFSGSIQLNIAGAAHLTQDELWAAARAAGLAADIEALPMGMFTYVAEGGTTLSGGQRQRLLIARALATKPAVLFFDEATSALDNATQTLVMHSLSELNATRVVIAQRLSTVRAADRVYVFDNGRVAQAGTFEELMSRPGLFRRLAARQLV